MSENLWDGTTLKLTELYGWEKYRIRKMLSDACIRTTWPSLSTLVHCVGLTAKVQHVNPRSRIISNTTITKAWRCERLIKRAWQELKRVVSRVRLRKPQQRKDYRETRGRECLVKSWDRKNKAFESPSRDKIRASQN